MPRSVPSHATPEILKWARESAGLSIEQVAQAESIEGDVLREWEKGNGTPTFAKLKKLAKRYKRPMMVFYLSERPTDFSIVKDYRTLPADFARTYSTELINAIRSIQERQAWAADYLEESGGSKTTIIRNGAQIKSVSEMSRKIRSRLGITIQKVSECDNSHQAFNLWRNACESLGVFVFQVRGVMIEEMRGFALPNSFAPVIALNSKDAITARIFTLIHEFVHLARNESALTGSGLNLFTPAPDYKVETFCNSVAAEVLVPSGDFIKRVPSDWQTSDDEAIKKLAIQYRVSRAVIAFRLVDLQFADHEFVKTKLSQYAYTKSERKSAPIPQDKLALAHNGESFTKLALNAYQQGEIHGGELSKLLQLKLKHLGSLESKIFPNRIQPLLNTQS